MNRLPSRCGRLGLVAGMCVVLGAPSAHAQQPVQPLRPGPRVPLDPGAVIRDPRVGPLPPTQAPCGGVIRPFEAIIATIPSPGAACTYRYDGTQGEGVTISMRARDGQIDPYLKLIAPDGTVVAEDDDSGGGRDASIWLASLPATGAFTLVAGTFDGATTGAFEMNLSLFRLHQMTCVGEVALGETVSDTVVLSQSCRYTFDGTAGQRITVRMNKVDPALDPRLELRDPSDAVEAADDDGGGNGNSLIANHVLQATGQYTIHAGSHDDASEGAFTLALQAGSVAGDVAPALLSAAEARQVIRFNPGAALQRRIFAAGFVPNSAEFNLTHAGVVYVGQRSEHLGTGEVRVYFVAAGDWGDVRFVRRGSPAAGVEAVLLNAGQANQVIQFNPGAALQQRIFGAGFVPNSPEFAASPGGVAYSAQRAEHLGTGEVRVYYARVPQWNDVRSATRP